jgi:hypothetical protein
VKSGKVTAPHVRDLSGVVGRERAVVGALITLYQPTPAMVREAASAGAYESPTGLVPRIQILTIAQLLDPNSKRLQYPPPDAALSRPKRERAPVDQFTLPLVTTPESSQLPLQDVPTAAPPPYASKGKRPLARATGRPAGGAQLRMDQVDEAVPWQLSSRPPTKSRSRAAMPRRGRRRAG